MVSSSSTRRRRSRRYYHQSITRSSSSSSIMTLSSLVFVLLLSFIGCGLVGFVVSAGNHHHHAHQHHRDSSSSTDSSKHHRQRPVVKNFYRDPNDPCRVMSNKGMDVTTHLYDPSIRLVNCTGTKRCSHHTASHCSNILCKGENSCLGATFYNIITPPPPPKNTDDDDSDDNDDNTRRRLISNNRKKASQHHNHNQKQNNVNTNNHHIKKNIDDVGDDEGEEGDKADNATTITGSNGTSWMDGYNIQDHMDEMYGDNATNATDATDGTNDDGDGNEFNDGEFNDEFNNDDSDDGDSDEFHDDVSDEFNNDDSDGDEFDGGGSDDDEVVVDTSHFESDYIFWNITIGRGTGQIRCYDGACMRASFSVAKETYTDTSLENHVDVECIGNNACEEARFTNIHNLRCHGTKSCKAADIFARGDVQCDFAKGKGLSNRACTRGTTIIQTGGCLMCGWKFGCTNFGLSECKYGLFDPNAHAEDFRWEDAYRIGIPFMNCNENSIDPLIENTTCPEGWPHIEAIEEAEEKLENSTSDGEEESID